MDAEQQFHINLERTLIKTGPKFLSHTLVVNEYIAYIRPTVSAMMFCVIYILVGGLLLCLASIIYWRTTQLDLTLFIGGFGIAITTFGITLIKPFLKRVSFDKKTGCFNNYEDRDVKLSHVVSLQVNSKIISVGHTPHYPCYELNLLTINGRRINVLNHNDLPQLQNDAKILGFFLHIDVLDLRWHKNP